MKRVKSKVQFLTGLFIIMAVIVCSPAASWATFADYIDFNMGGSHPAGAIISFAGGNSSLSGINIGVDTVRGFNNSGNPTTGPVTITNGILTFTTGALISYSAGSPLNYGISTWLFSGAGSTLSITGNVAVTIPLSSNNLLSNGTFTNVLVQSMPSLGGSKFNITHGTFTDTKDSELAKYFFGYNPAGFVGGMNLSFFTTGVPGLDGSFSSSSVLSGDLTNNPVPLPGAVWLLGTGLIGLVGIRRRSRRLKG